MVWCAPTTRSRPRCCPAAPPTSAEGACIGGTRQGEALGEAQGGGKGRRRGRRQGRPRLWPVSFFVRMSFEPIANSTQVVVVIIALTFTPPEPRIDFSRGRLTPISTLACNAPPLRAHAKMGTARLTLERSAVWPMMASMGSNHTCCALDRTGSCVTRAPAQAL